MGNDRIGDLSIQFLRDNHIQCDNIVRYQGNSRLAIAFVDDPNNTEYQFYSPTVIPTLSYPETKKGDIVCYGSTHAIREEGRNDLLLFLNQARENNNLIIYDPNIRETNRLKLKTIREKVSENLQLTKILKGSTIDFDRLYNTKNIDKLFSRVNKLGVEALILTAGSDPVSLRTQSLSASFPVAPIEAVNTIGAGDNFTAGLVYGIVKEAVITRQLSILPLDLWERIMGYATSFASEVCRSEQNYISNEFVKQLAYSR